MNKRPVKYASLHTTIFIPGTIGQMGPTLSRDVGKTRDLTMYKVDGGLEVTMAVKGSSMDAFIPDAEIIIVLFDTEAEAKAKVEQAKLEAAQAEAKSGAKKP